MTRLGAEYVPGVVNGPMARLRPFRIICSVVTAPGP
jgi:hypothetical protein